MIVVDAQFILGIIIAMMGGLITGSSLAFLFILEEKIIPLILTILGLLMIVIGVYINS